MTLIFAVLSHLVVALTVSLPSPPTHHTDPVDVPTAQYYQVDFVFNGVVVVPAGTLETF